MIFSSANVQEMLFDSALSEDETKYSKKTHYEMNSSNFCPLMQIEVGDVKYRLLSSVDIQTYFDFVEQKWECWNYSGKFSYVGISETSREEAIENFKFQIHIRFQQLYSMRPFEMTEDEYKEWICLANTIDLLYYKTTTPIKIREVGCVSFGKLSYPYRIKWLTDENYTINPSNVPAELMSFKRPGQWIEAIVERDPIDYRVIKISSVRKIKFHVPREGEAKKYLDEMSRIELNK